MAKRDRHHEQTRLARRLAEAGAVKDVSPTYAGKFLTKHVFVLLCRIVSAFSDLDEAAGPHRARAGKECRN